MKQFILALACVGLAGGVASADRFHGSRGGGSHTGGSAVVRDHRSGGEFHGAREGGVRVTEGARGNRPVVRGGYENRGYNRGYENRGYVNRGYERRPIYVARPYIRQRYFDYRYRPSVIVENYPARDGYIWIAGQWTWNGGEWIWQPGHYEADPNWGVNAGVYVE